MSVHDLVFQYQLEPIYDAIQVGATQITITISNLGTSDVESVGLYIVPSTNLGDLDYPSTYNPYTDYEDLLTWGERSHLGITVSGGLKYEVTGPDGNEIGYIRRSKGALLSNKIPLATISAGNSTDVKLTMELPSGESARRFYVDIKVE